MTTNIHISFDLDGTLIDSIPLMKLSWENVNSKLNLGIGWEAYRENLGLPFSQICKNLSLEGYESEIYKLYFKFNKENVGRIEAMSGLQDCIFWLNSNDIDWSIITSKPKFTTTLILDLFNLNPRVLITDDDVKNGKPYSEASQLLLSQLSNRIDKIYYVGDTVIDHLFSINSKFEFIEFNKLTGSQYILNKRHIISNLLDIKNIIQE